MSKVITRTARTPGELTESDRWRTPLQCFNALHVEFVFDVDLAADETNMLLPVWYGPGSPWREDSLAIDEPWYGKVGEGNSRGFLNPPYSSALIKAFVERAAFEGQFMLIAALLPDTHDTQWYRDLRWAAEIRRIPHRVPYLRADGVTKAGAMFPSCVAIFRPQPGVRNPTPRIVEWSWRAEE